MDGLVSLGTRKEVDQTVPDDLYGLLLVASHRSNSRTFACMNEAQVRRFDCRSSKAHNQHIETAKQAPILTSSLRRHRRPGASSD